MTKSSIVKSVCWQHYTLHPRRRKPLCKGSARHLDAIPSSFEALGVEADRRSTSKVAAQMLILRHGDGLSAGILLARPVVALGNCHRQYWNKACERPFHGYPRRLSPLGGSQAEDPTRTRYSKNHVLLSAGAGRVIIGTLYIEAYELPNCSIRVASWFRSCRSVPTVPTMFGRTPRISHITLSTT